MKTKLTHFHGYFCHLLILAGLSLCLTARAALISGLFNSGVDDAGTPLPNASFDPHYTLVGGSPILGSPLTATSSNGFPIPPWLADNSSSAWITPGTNTIGPGAMDGSAIYRYQIQFDLTGLDPATAAITGQWATDNHGIDILINGASTGQANSSQFGAWTPFVINRGFFRGSNVLTFLLSNGEGELTPDGPTGLRVEMAGVASLAPSIPGLFNTGVDNVRSPQADNAAELHYTVAGPSGMKQFPFVATSAGGFPVPPWLPDNSISAWIGPSPSTEGANAMNGAANYSYLTGFDLTGRDPATAVIDGQWATDNHGIDVLINGVSTAQANPAEFASWTPFRIDHGFVPGFNTLAFLVNNGAGDPASNGPTGLRVEMRGSALSNCVDFQTFLPMTVPPVWFYGGIRFIARDPFGNFLAPAGIENRGGLTGLRCGWQLEIDLPDPCDSVELTLVDFAAPPVATAFNASGVTVATAAMVPPQNVPETLKLNGTGISRVVVVCPSDETLLLGMCCRAGPRNLPPIDTITKDGGIVTLTWRALPGKLYRVQFRPNLNQGPWMDLAGDISGRGGIASKVDDTIGAAPQRFYRVIEAPAADAPGSPTVSGSPARATVSWLPVAGASGYSVERWSQLNPDCCRTTSPFLAANVTSWEDANYPLAGAYIFRVTAHYPNGTYGVAEVIWVRPTPQDPTGFTATYVSGNTVQLTWQPVPGVTRYLVGGPGANSAVPVAGTTLAVTGVPDGLQTWKIFSLYEPGGVFTAGVVASTVVPVVLTGWVDLHTHPMINLAFGGKLVHGGVDVGSLLPQDLTCQGETRATSIGHALGDDRATQGGVLDLPCGDELRKAIIGNLQGRPGPETFGFPSFVQWPKWSDITHQKMWIDWIERARDGGLRVMVALATNNKTLGDVLHGPTDTLPTDDAASARLQITEIKDLVARHSNFMEIALNAADIKRIVRMNKIAIVLGVEIDNIGNFNTFGFNSPNFPMDLAENLITNEVQRLFDSGVRYVFPIHVLDNAFGGTALYKGGFNTSNFREAGHYWIIECAPASDLITYEYKPSEVVSDNIVQDTIAFLKLGLDPFRHPGPSPVCAAGTGHRNALGLTPPGVIAIKAMMKRGMIIDIDHMSHRSAEGTLAIAETFGYPLVSGHTGIRGLAGAHAENSRTPLQLQRLSKLHGMFGLGSDGTSAMQWSQLYQQAMFEMGFRSSDPAKANYQNGAVSFGTDLNGLVQGPQPGGGDRVHYDESFPMSSTGSKSWNYNTEGVAHYGMLPDFIKDVQSAASIGYIGAQPLPPVLTGTELVEDHLFRSADYFWHMWERIEAQKVTVP